jgi:hypothetical protein
MFRLLLLLLFFVALLLLSVSVAEHAVLLFGVHVEVVASLVLVVSAVDFLYPVVL